jgi:hypothetical protein
MKQPQFLDEAFSNICSTLLTTFIRKHRDYGKDNILDTGEMGIIFRINDKINRLKNLEQNNKEPQNESIEETWVDIAVYSVIAIMYRKGWFQKLDLKP